ncbi:hypothetical protein F7725_011907, partial [Dissostichus mawsoni]
MGPPVSTPSSVCPSSSGSNEAPLKLRIAPSHTLALLILNLLQDVFVIFAESSAKIHQSVPRSAPPKGLEAEHF